jgi:hypothetical protein
MSNLGIERAKKKFQDEIEGLDKYGFIYKWIDTKRDRYYIGSHWGTFSDKYICSSNSMRDAYHRRSKTFKRKILKVVTTNRLDLLDVEQEYIDNIPNKHFGKQAYNVSTSVYRPWWAKGHRHSKKVLEKISIVSKRTLSDPRILKKLNDGSKKYWKNNWEKIVQAKKDYWFKDENRKAQSKRIKKHFQNPKNKENQSAKLTKYWSDPTVRKIQSKKLQKHFQKPENRKRQSDQAKDFWSKPSNQKKMSAIASDRWSNTKYHEKMCKAQTERWLKPKARKKHGDGQRKRFENAEEREKIAKKVRQQIWMHKGKKVVKLQKKQEKEYLAKGYIRGRGKLK